MLIVYPHIEKLLTSMLFFVHSTVSELFLNKIQPQVGSAQLELVHYLFH